MARPDGAGGLKICVYGIDWVGDIVVSGRLEGRGRPRRSFGSGATRFFGAAHRLSPVAAGRGRSHRFRPFCACPGMRCCSTHSNAPSDGALAWLKRRYMLGAFMAFLGAPAAYYSGHQMGALTFFEPLWKNLAILAMAWAVSLPFLFFLSVKLGRPKKVA
jgi:hypothetical protein